MSKLKLIAVSKIEIALTLLGHHNGEIDYPVKIFRRFLLAPSAKSSEPSGAYHLENKSNIPTI